MLCALLYLLLRRAVRWDRWIFQRTDEHRGRAGGPSPSAEGPQAPGGQAAASPSRPGLHGRDQPIGESFYWGYWGPYLSLPAPAGEPIGESLYWARTCPRRTGGGAVGESFLLG